MMISSIKTKNKNKQKNREKKRRQLSTPHREDKNFYILHELISCLFLRHFEIRDSVSGVAVLWYAQAALQSDRSQSFFVCLFICSVILSGRWVGLGNPQEGPLSQSDEMTQMLWVFLVARRLP